MSPRPKTERFRGLVEDDFEVSMFGQDRGIGAVVDSSRFDSEQQDVEANGHGIPARK